MKTKNTRWLALAGFAFVAVTFIAWKNSDPTHSVYHYSPGYEQQAGTDTAPVRKKSHSYKKEYKLSELDEAMQEVDRAMVELDKGLKIDLSKMNKEILAAMDEIKNINFNKIHDEVRASLKEVDWESVKEDVKRANKEVEKELKSIDRESIRADVEAARAGAFISGDLIKNSVELGLKAARLGINKAKKELMLLKEFTEELEKDGLINKKGSFKIQIKDHEMFIDGKKQSKEVNEKYKKYFRDGEYSLTAD
jgi:hypothetical protein